MSLIRFARQFGLRSTLVKAQSAIALRLFSKRILRESAPVDASAIPGLRHVDLETMPAEYRPYIRDQISQSLRRSTYVNPLRRMIGSRDRLVQHLATAAEAWQIPCDNILSIGCRDERELDTLARLLRCRHVSGVDLFSASPRIRVADMHDLPFGADTFDATVAIHCMEHSYNPRRSLSEMTRVTKRGGLLAVEVPVGFEATPVDRNDFTGIVQLASLFPENAVSIIWAEVENRSAHGKPHTMRAIFQKAVE